jgi:4-amino-4-deoxy-L-arabinose transferase-like glycosyltransferase
LRLPTSIRRCAALTYALFFVAIGCAFIPQAGIEEDEALFGAAIYDQSGVVSSIPLVGHRIPLMEMSYLGSLKSWIYAPIFRRWKPSAASIRFPALVFGGITIWLFWLLLHRIAGYRAATIGSVLLATDTSFLMTTCFDWGPVVLQHLLLVSGVLCLVRFHQEQQRRFLAAGFLFFGLGMWDKALFAWILSGTAIATLVVFPKELWRHFSGRNLSVATLAFCLGAAPLIRYNIREKLITFRANAAFDKSEVPGKIHQVFSTLAGQALFDYIARNDLAGGHPRSPQTAVERVSMRVSQIARDPENGFLGFALLAAFLLFPWLWFTPARRPMAFSLIAATVAWLQMLFGKGVGGSAHHVILLWPYPTLFIAVAFAEASRRLGSAGKPLLALVVLFLAGSSLLVTNEYLALLIRNGPGEVWTDAVYPLSDYLKRVKPPAIYADDWGMINILTLLNRGSMPLRVGTDPLLKSQLDPEDRRMVLDRIAESESVFATHPGELELFKGVDAKLMAMAAEAGYRRETLAEISDRNGRRMFQVFRFRR